MNFKTKKKNILKFSTQKKTFAVINNEQFRLQIPKIHQPNKFKPCLQGFSQFSIKFNIFPLTFRL